MGSTTKLKNIRILIIDNVDYIRHGISLQLNQISNPIYTISACSSVEDARQLVKQRNFDVLITDLVISAEERAGDLIKWLRHDDDHKNIKVIINTLHTEALLVYFFLMELEVDAYIYTKDIDNDTPCPTCISDIIEQVFDGKYKRFGSEKNKAVELKMINQDGQPFCSPQIEETIDDLLKEGFYLPTKRKFNANNSIENELTEEQKERLEKNIEKVIISDYFTEREEAIMGLFISEVMRKYHANELDSVDNIKAILFNLLDKNDTNKNIYINGKSITKDIIGNDLREIRSKLCLSDYPIALIVEIAEKLGNEVITFLKGKAEKYFAITL
jgi:DNA-binding NarL/FixJ family response regulator